MIRVPEMLETDAALLEKHVKACKKCGGIGYRSTEGEDISEGLVPCSCRAHVLFISAMVHGGVPKEFWNVEGFDIRHNHEAFERAYKYCEKLKKAKAKGLGFVLYGSNGTGKTTFGTFVLAKAARARFTVGYILAEDYIRSVFRDDSVVNWVGELERADFLFIDEMGKEYRKGEGGFDMTKLDILIRTRRSAMLPTIIATNLSRQGFEDRYGESIDSVLSDRNEWLAFEPGDARKGEV
jgi:DNA replication protein DnaC